MYLDDGSYSNVLIFIKLQFLTYFMDIFRQESFEDSFNGMKDVMILWKMTAKSCWLNGYMV